MTIPLWAPALIRERNGKGNELITGRRFNDEKEAAFSACSTAGLFVAGFGVATFPAIAELRVITITLEGGQKVTTTVDVPPDTPLDQIQLPEITAPIEGVEEAAPKPSRPQASRLAGRDGRTRAAAATRPHRPRPRSTRSIRQSEGEPQVETPTAPTRTAPTPTASRPTSNPTLSLGLPGPAPVGVPNFVINKFRIPPFLLPHLPGRRRAVRHPLGGARRDQRDRDRLRPQPQRLLRRRARLDAVHSSSWRMYGVDANRDGEKDPYNPVDAIFAAGRYLKAAGGDNDLRRAIFAYNHADWYVDSVLMRARLIAGMPADVVGSLTGLTQGHFPVHAKLALRGRPARARRAPARPQGPARAQRRQARRVEATSAARSTSTAAAALR